MFTSGPSPLTPLRASLWHFLLFAGVAWLAVAWSMLRLEPVDAVRVAGPVILFGAVSEALRALTGSARWGLHTGLAVLFAATGAVLILDEDASLATPVALVGWYLLVRGAADIALSTSARGADRSWGVMLVLGVMQLGLGFYAASSYARSPWIVVLLLAALAVVRAVADLVTALDLREAPVGRADRERVAGAAGYAAGLADYAAAATGRAGRPRHRARGLLAGRADPDEAAEQRGEPGGDADEVRAPAGVPDLAMAGATIDGNTTGTNTTGGSEFRPLSPAEVTLPSTMFTGPQHHEPARIDLDLPTYRTTGHADPRGDAHAADPGSAGGALRPGGDEDAPANGGRRPGLLRRREASRRRSS